MTIAVASLLLLAVLGALLRARGLGGAASVAASALAVAFAVALVAMPRVHIEAQAVPVARAALPTSLSEVRTQALAAAAVAAPAADALRLQWQTPLPAAFADGVLGAMAERPAVLPLQPEALQVRALAPPRRDRPLALAVEAGALAAPLPARLVVRTGSDVVCEHAVVLGPAPVQVACRPTRTGRHTLEVVVDVAGHQVRATGGFDVAEPPSVLVLEDGLLLSAALRTQGLEVVTASEPPADWRAHAAIVVGKALSARAQNELFAALLDGLGVFVLEPAFGGDGEPMRALLPVRPLPATPDATGDATAPGPASEPEPKPADPPPPPPNANEPPKPPSGDVRPSQVSKDPIEVDKHAIAMVLVIDRSTSMRAMVRGNSVISYAKTAAVRTAEMLGEGDTVGVVTFGHQDEGRTVLPLTPATQIDSIRAVIEKIDATDNRTYVLGGLRIAHDMLANSKSAVKHVVVVTDGQAEEGRGVRISEATRLRKEALASLSIIMIQGQGDDSSDLATNEMVTKAGGGQFFPLFDASEVPAFVVAEVTRALQRVGRSPGGDDRTQPETTPPTAPPPTTPPPAEPPPTAPPAPQVPRTQRLPVRAVAQTPLLDPVPSPEWPTLGAACAGEAKFEAQTLLVAGDAGWPLLAFVNRGLGRVGAFAADLAGEPAREFRAERSFPARFAQWVQSVVPPEPVLAPAPLLDQVAVTPPAPTPRDDATLAAVAGQPAVDAARGSEVTGWQRTEQAAAPAFAPWLLAGIVLLAALERGSRVRRLRDAG